MRKTSLYKILFLVTFWALAAIFIVFKEAAVLGLESGESILTYSLARDLFIALLVTVMSGTAIACFEVFFLKRFLRRRPFGTTLLIKTVFYLSCIYVFTSLAVLMMFSYEMDLPVFHLEVTARFGAYLFSAEIVMTLIYWGTIVFLSLFMLEVSEKFGQGVLLQFLLGKYHQPKEEHRIFMFLDLKSSTTYAEILGHLKYSKLIQDCFFDLTDVITRYHAVIYQYVGDEVVLTWDMQHGIEDGNCLQTFYAFDDALKSRGSYYEAEYGLIPEFKAGVNAGMVMVAEVGEIKKDLAYHGDVLNTASRIQGKCNELGHRLLLSEHVKNLFKGDSGYRFDFIGNVALKGKKQPIQIYDVLINTSVNGEARVPVHQLGSR